MDGTSPERCGECGFDSSRWRLRDVASFFEALGRWWRLALADLPAAGLNRRPDAAVWSVLEYGLHSALVTAVNRYGAELILGADGIELPAPPGAESSVVLELDPDAIVGDLEREGAAMADLARRSPGGWANRGRLPDGTPLQAEALVFHAAHDASHHLMDVGRGLSAVGLAASAGTGSVVQINISGGGVPKHPVPGAAVAWDGLSGDVQADRKHHGRPFQAVSLWSSEVIGGLAEEGHRLGPGSAGENLTLSGLDWDRLRPGVRLRIGTTLVELSFPATPCHKQARWFTDGDFNRISHDRNPGLARWYGWVREPGTVSQGDEVALQP